MYNVDNRNSPAPLRVHRMGILFWLLLLVTVPLVVLMDLLVYASSKSSHFFKLADHSPLEEITVLVPFHNNEDTIRSTIDRILLNSALIPTHLVVINNCSSDDTEEILRKYLKNREVLDVTYLSYSDRLSKAGALTEGLRLVSTELVALVDADVLLEHTALPRLARFLKATKADVVSGFVLYDSVIVRDLPAWDKCLSHGTIRLGRSRLGLCPNIPGQVVLARCRVLSGNERGDSLLEDLALSNSIYRRRLRLEILSELVARENYPNSIGFLWRQRTRWLIGNFEVIPSSIKSAVQLGWRRALGVLMHLPIYHVFPALIPIWILFSFFHPWPCLVVALLLTGLYALAAWNGARNTNSQGTIGSLLLFVLVFPWIHLLAWITGIPLYLLKCVFKIDAYHRSFFYRR